MGIGKVSESLQTLFSTKVKTSSRGLTDFILSTVSSDQQVSASKDPFYVLDLGVVKSLMDDWEHLLPEIQPFYAVKCNPDPTLLRMLAELGAGFDCASKAEIESVLALGVSPDRIIYANPCKTEAHIRYAASVGVNLATYDSLDEVYKIKKCHPKCGLVLRIMAGDDVADALCPLGSKYGAWSEEVVPLLQAANTAQLPVLGVSFHVGSAIKNPLAYDAAIKGAKDVFDAALQLGMPKMRILDVGGGFSAGSQLKDIAQTINSSILSHFGTEHGLKLVAEPGRYFAAQPFTLVTNIIAKRTRGGLREYWINDGVYGSINCILNAHAILADPSPLPLYKGATTHRSTLFGPTCCALDLISTNLQLPELQVGDWLVFPNIGAYSSSGGSNFNGFDTSAIPTFVTYLPTN